MARKAFQRSGLPEPDRHGSIRAVSMSGFHTIAFTDWGPLEAESTVVCVHGLTRQGRDFDHLAAALAKSGHRVVCPDLVGRGRSGSLPNAFDYVFPQYCADLVTLMATLGNKPVSWVGSSLGGLIGIVLAGLSRSPITRLVVNDIGPDVPALAAARVGLLLRRMPRSFATLAEADAYFRDAYAGYGQLAEEHWSQIARHSVTWDSEQERFVLLFDPKVAIAFQWCWAYQSTLWDYWRKIKIPILSLRGVASDFLPDHLLDLMRNRAPQLLVHEVQGVGHMPMLMDEAQIDVVAAFLKR